jgi:hypothetical protein
MALAMRGAHQQAGACSESRVEHVTCRKPVWLRLQRAGLVRLRATLFSPLTVPEARRILQGRQLGIASLRLLPKRTGTTLPALLFLWVSPCHCYSRYILSGPTFSPGHHLCSSLD